MLIDLNLPVMVIVDLRDGTVLCIKLHGVDGLREIRMAMGPSCKINQP